MSEVEILPVHRLCAQLRSRGADLIELSAYIDRCHRKGEPIMLQLYVEEVREKIDALDQALAAYERSREASVEIVTPSNVVPIDHAAITGGA
jgi:hypothetical protein